MRRVLDPAKTRDDVLSASIRLFAENGYAATSINDIAKAASVTKSLVLYHFGSKDALWQAAVETRVEPLVELFKRYLSDRDPSLNVARMMRHRFEFLRDHPEMQRILAWMSLDSAPLPSALTQDAPKVMAKAIREIQRTSPSVADPAMLVAIVLGAMDGWFRYRTLYSAVAGLTESEETDERFIVELLKHLPQEAAT